ALLLWRARRRFHGELGLAFLVAYPLLRAAMDLTRIKLGPWPSADQVVSVAVALTAVGMWLWRRSALERVPALWPGRPGPVGRVGPEASESDPVHPDPLRGRQVL
ncbi:MAG: hypothetical protein HY691_08695, partial [Chloroflexi bacterium]|nr:hypothetical protein [Chloroflexota bacterium]